MPFKPTLTNSIMDQTALIREQAIKYLNAAVTYDEHTSRLAEVRHLVYPPTSGVTPQITPLTPPTDTL